MYSFYDIDGDIICFEDIEDLYLETSTDIVAGDVGGYFVEYNDEMYEVDENVYQAIKNKKVSTI